MVDLEYIDVEYERVGRESSLNSYLDASKTFGRAVGGVFLFCGIDCADQVGFFNYLSAIGDITEFAAFSSFLYHSLSDKFRNNKNHLD